MEPAPAGSDRAGQEERMADQLDVAPEHVIGGGRRTAATTVEWSGWAAQVRIGLWVAAASARDTSVTSALEDHLSRLAPALARLAANSEALGGNAVTAACVVVDADDSAGQLVGRQVADGQTRATVLARPLHAG